MQQTYSHVFLDEFQDCTNEQYQLVRAAFLGTRTQLTAVGDTKQRIMGWAGALEGIFEIFARDFKAVGLNLYQNFRSLPRLRRMQNAMVKVMDPAAAVPDEELVGEGGTVETLEFRNSEEEAEALAGQIDEWIARDGIRPSEIAILVSKQADLYAASLMKELSNRKIAFRDEQKLQDLAVEPAARLIVDFLAVVIGEREPDAFGRLMDMLLATGLDENETDEMRSRWYRFFNDSRDRVRKGTVDASDVADLRVIAGEFLKLVGRSALVALAAEYEHGKRLEEVIDQTYERLAELLNNSGDPGAALSMFSQDSAVRIMTIHKSKSLEFENVVILGVENETFWGKIDDERSAYFVGISRAKRYLGLTVVGHRDRPVGYTGRWNEKRGAQQEFLSYASETS